jgi:predicted RNA-binding protein with PIN domain
MTKTEQNTLTKTLARRMGSNDLAKTLSTIHRSTQNQKTKIEMEKLAIAFGVSNNPEFHQYK